MSSCQTSQVKRAVPRAASAGPAVNGKATAARSHAAAAAGTNGVAGRTPVRSSMRSAVRAEDALNHSMSSARGDEVEYPYDVRAYLRSVKQLCGEIEHVKVLPQHHAQEMRELLERQKAEAEKLKASQAKDLAERQRQVQARLQQLEQDLEDRLKLVHHLLPKGVTNIRARLMKEVQTNGDIHLLPKLLTEEKRAMQALKRRSHLTDQWLATVFKELHAAAYNVDAILKGVAYRACVEDGDGRSSLHNRYVVVKPLPAGKDEPVVAYAHTRLCVGDGSVENCVSTFADGPTRFAAPGVAAPRIVCVKAALTEMRRKRRNSVAAGAPGTLTPAEVVERSTTCLEFGGAKSLEFATNQDVEAVVRDVAPQVA